MKRRTIINGIIGFIAMCFYPLKHTKNDNFIKLTIGDEKTNLGGVELSNLRWIQKDPLIVEFTIYKDKYVQFEVKDIEYADSTIYLYLA